MASASASTIELRSQADYLASSLGLRLLEDYKYNPNQYYTITYNVNHRVLLHGATLDQVLTWLSGYSMGINRMITHHGGNTPT